MIVQKKIHVSIHVGSLTLYSREAVAVSVDHWRAIYHQNIETIRQMSFTGTCRTEAPRPEKKYPTTRTD